MACPLDNLNDNSLNPAVIVEKIQRMINNNIAIVFILVLLVIFLMVSLFYFGSSIFKTLKDYYINREVSKPDPSTTNSLKDRNADNEVYEEPSNENDADQTNDEFKVQVDPVKFMPRARRNFIKELEIENKQYNEDKTQFMTKRLNYPVNDDVVDDKILYKDYDNYRYDYYTE
jgi:flagellar basal body-associated protein FliL